MATGDGPRPDLGVGVGRHSAVESTRRRKKSGAGAREAASPAGAEELRIEVRGGSPVSVRVAGDLDLRTAPVLADRIDGLGPVDVVIECDDLRFVDSIGVSLLVRMRHEFRAHGRTLVLRGVSGVPRRTLEILGLTDSLGLADG